MTEQALTRLHVVGCPRSGTTLMMEMLATCYEHAGHCEHEETFFKVPDVRSGLYLSKQPNDVNWIEPIVRRDPSAFFVAMIRDPRAVVCSRHSGHEGLYFANYRIWKKAERSIVRLMKYSHVVVVQFEDLTADPDRVQRDIENAFPFLVRKHPFSEYHHHARVSAGSDRALGGVRAVSGAANSSWRRHLPRLAQQLDRHPGMADDLMAWGYERDKSWMQALDGVSPVQYPCRYPDRPTPLRDLESGFRIRRKRARYRKSMGID